MIHNLNNSEVMNLRRQAKHWEETPPGPLYTEFTGSEMIIRTWQVRAMTNEILRLREIVKGMDLQ